MSQGTYYARTTEEQRAQLFKAWEETSNVEQACQEAGVSRSTFYAWKDRFENGGYEALSEYDSRAPHTTRRVSSEVETEVVSIHQSNPGWGKRRIASELSIRGSVTKLVSPNTVKRILQGCGLWPRK
jgi:transposase